EKSLGNLGGRGKAQRAPGPPGRRARGTLRFAPATQSTQSNTVVRLPDSLLPRPGPRSTRDRRPGLALRGAPRGSATGPVPAGLGGQARARETAPRGTRRFGRGRSPFSGVRPRINVPISRDQPGGGLGGRDQGLPTVRE